MSLVSVAGHSVGVGVVAAVAVAVGVPAAWAVRRFLAFTLGFAQHLALKYGVLFVLGSLGLSLEWVVDGGLLRFVGAVLRAVGVTLPTWLREIVDVIGGGLP